MQMMSIRETQEESCDSCEQMDAQLRSFVAQQLQLGERLQLLELVLDQDTRGSWVATKQTTARCALTSNIIQFNYLFMYLFPTPGQSPGTATVVSGPRAPPPPPSGRVDRV